MPEVRRSSRRPPWSSTSSCTSWCICMSRITHRSSGNGSSGRCRTMSSGRRGWRSMEAASLQRRASRTPVKASHKAPNKVGVKSSQALANSQQSLEGELVAKLPVIVAVAEHARPSPWNGTMPNRRRPATQICFPPAILDAGLYGGFSDLWANRKSLLLSSCPSRDGGLRAHRLARRRPSSQHRRQRPIPTICTPAAW